LRSLQKNRADFSYRLKATGWEFGIFVFKNTIFKGRN